MCIVFVNLNATAGAEEYKLVLASNRDEFYNRRSKPAHFWNETTHSIIGGMDMEPGREGGTWLAMESKTGRLATLLNILSPKFSDNKRGRGSIVKDYLEFDGTAIDFCQEIEKEADQYNPFNLIMIDLMNGENAITQFSCGSHERPKRLNNVGSYAFGNTLFSTPYQKVKDGQLKFNNIIQTFSRTDQREQLIESLLQLLKSEERHYPDPLLVMEASHSDCTQEDFRKGLSSRFVHIPHAKYGTRTHTLTLVNGKNEVIYEEWTMEEPIVNSYNPNWIHSRFSFPLKVNLDDRSQPNMI